MVNSGSFESSALDGNRNDRIKDTRQILLNSKSSAADGGELPSEGNHYAIEPTPSQTTEINNISNMPQLQQVKNAHSSTSTRKLLCFYCDRTFVRVNLRQKHVDRVHSVKSVRRVSRRRKNGLLSISPICKHCEELNSTSEIHHSLDDLFVHLVHEHSAKYFGCLSCKERFASQIHLNEHNIDKHHLVEDVSTKSILLDEVVTRSKVRSNNNEQDERKTNNKKGKTEAAVTRGPKKISVKGSKIALKRSKRLQQKDGKHVVQIPKKRRERKPTAAANNTKSFNLLKHQPEKLSNNYSSLNPYPEFDHFYRVKKITDHSIDNLKIGSLTFDDVFDKAFFNRIKCNIQENLINHIDGKLFKNEESENRISNFEKISHIDEIQTLNAENFGCEISLNAITPTPTSLSIINSQQQFGEDLESQIEYGAKPSKKKTQTKSDEVHYKYFTRRKYQASILQQKENRDLSKLDMWTQMVIKERQQQIINKKKSPEEFQEYISGQEYTEKIKREELNKILDRRGPFEDLKEEVSKKAAFDKLMLNASINKSDIREEIFLQVREVVNELLIRVFSNIKNENHHQNETIQDDDHREIPTYLDLRRKTCTTNDEIDKSDKIALICSSQETENFELPTNSIRDKNELVELTGEWARSRMYICAACGGKLSNLKYLIEHKSLYHQSVWVQHYEFVGNQSELYKHLSIPGLGKVGIVEENIPSLRQLKKKKNEARSCKKCGKLCNTLSELHRHILECGGDWTWISGRKKYKYRAYGARGRRKRRGFETKIQNKQQKTEPPTEKEICKKPAMSASPRQRPSDADTIQRMLANLPAKRLRRSIISLPEVVFKTRSTTKSKKSTIIPVAKLNKSDHLSRSFNKILSNRVLDMNSSILIKRKMQTLRSQRKMSEQSSKKEILLQDEDKKVSAENKRIVGSNKLSLKNFFPVKKKYNKKKSVVNNMENIVDKSKYFESLKQLNKKRGGLKSFVARLSLRNSSSNKGKSNKNETKNNKKQKNVNVKMRKNVQRTFKNVITKTKKLAIEVMSVRNIEEDLPFLEQSTDAMSVITSPTKIIESQTFVPAHNSGVEDCKENPPVPETIFNLENNEDKNLQAKEIIDSPIEISSTINNDDNQKNPKSCSKGKLRKSSRGLNDCIAMLTSKLKEKDEKTCSTLNDLSITSEIQKKNPASELVENIALDLTKKPEKNVVARTNLDNTIDFVAKGSLTSEVANYSNYSIKSNKKKKRTELITNIIFGKDKLIIAPSKDPENELDPLIARIKENGYKMSNNKNIIIEAEDLQQDEVVTELNEENLKDFQNIKEIEVANTDSLKENSVSKNNSQVDSSKIKKKRNRSKNNEEISIKSGDMSENARLIRRTTRKSKNSNKANKSEDDNLLFKDFALVINKELKEIVPINTDTASCVCDQEQISKSFENDSVEEMDMEIEEIPMNSSNIIASDDFSTQEDQSGKVKEILKDASNSIEEKSLNVDNFIFPLKESTPKKMKSFYCEEVVLEISNFGAKVPVNKLLEDVNFSMDKVEDVPSSEINQNIDKISKDAKIMNGKIKIASEVFLGENNSELSQNKNGIHQSTDLFNQDEYLEFSELIIDIEETREVEKLQDCSINNNYDKSLEEDLNVMESQSKSIDEKNLLSVLKSCIVDEQTNDKNVDLKSIKTNAEEENEEDTVRLNDIELTGPEEISKANVEIMQEESAGKIDDNLISCAEEVALVEERKECEDRLLSELNIKDLLFSNFSATSDCIYSENLQPQKQKKNKTMRKLKKAKLEANNSTDLRISTLKSVLDAEGIFSEIQPLSEIISSSEMDIAPVLDEIDKSLESEDVYDFTQIVPKRKKSEVHQEPMNRKRTKYYSIVEDLAIDKEGLELRRSRRESRKVTSYNENDLIDPIIDALENRRSNNKKVIKIVSTSILETNNKSDGKEDLLQQERSSNNHQELSDADKIYEFTENSSDNNEEIKELFLGKTKRKIHPPVSSVEENNPLQEDIYCDICKKSFIRLENLLKHKRTLTHISKLSELEAKEAEAEKTKLENPMILNSAGLLKENAAANILSDDIPPSVFSAHSTVEANSSLQIGNLVEPVIIENCSPPRFKSLGERKSFELDPAAILENQINLLENIIGGAVNNETAEGEFSNHATVVNFVKPPPQYEEISEDSINNVKIYGDLKQQRKTLNRDEELFLECCSLLKSSSEISNYSKLTEKPLQIAITAQENLVQSIENAHQYSDNNSRTPTPLGDTFNDDASNSNTISSNWHLNSEKPLDKNRSFSFEEVKSKEEISGMSFGEILTNGLKNQFEGCNYIIRNQEKDGKIATKGARKVYEGLKVSIPMEDLNLEMLQNRKPVKVIDEGTPNIKCRSTRKSKPVKKFQVGSNLLFKVNKKKSPTTVPTLTTDDVPGRTYDEEVFGSNLEVMENPVKNVSSSTIDTSLEYSKNSINVDVNSISSNSSTNLSSKKYTVETFLSAENNITKKKSKIMGKIFKNAAKTKPSDGEQTDENEQNQVQENYARNCEKLIKSPLLTPAPINEELPKNPKMTEEEMSKLFDQLLGKDVNNEVNNKPKENSKQKNLDMKKRNSKGKSSRKRTRTNSNSSGDEFSLKNNCKKRNSKKCNQDDSGINLELELKECIGVASRKSQRSCTSGKQNVLVEYWSSDEEAFEAFLLNSTNHQSKMKKSGNPANNNKTNISNITTTSTSTNSNKKIIRNKKSKNFKNIVENDGSSIIIGNNNTTSTNRKKRVSANPLYHWSSSSDEDDESALIEVKPIRDDEGKDDDDEEDDRPIQHGWIVGDSPKKLVTMLALTKRKKIDVDCVKEQSKRRNNNNSTIIS